MLVEEEEKETILRNKTREKSNKHFDGNIGK
jgi:hypothetical protein